MGFFASNTRKSTPPRERLAVLRELYRMREAQTQTASTTLQYALHFRNTFPRVALLFAEISKTANSHAEVLQQLLQQNNISLPKKDAAPVNPCTCEQNDVASARDALHRSATDCRTLAMQCHLTAKLARNATLQNALLQIAERNEEHASALDSMGARLSRS